MITFFLLRKKNFPEVYTKMTEFVDEYDKHLQNVAFSVATGEMAFDSEHPYRYNKRFIRILILTLDEERQYWQDEEEYERCGVLRDAKQQMEQHLHFVKAHEPVDPQHVL